MENRRFQSKTAQRCQETHRTRTPLPNILGSSKPLPSPWSLSHLRLERENKIYWRHSKAAINPIKNVAYLYRGTFTIKLLCLSLWLSQGVREGATKARVDERGAKPLVDIKLTWYFLRFICIIFLFLLAWLRSLFFRAAVGDGHFITLVLVKKTGHSLSNSPAEWIWSDLFSWISYELGHERCIHWYRNQPHPKIYLGKTHNLKSSWAIRP